MIGFLTHGLIKSQAWLIPVLPRGTAVRFELGDLIDVEESAGYTAVGVRLEGSHAGETNRL